MTPARIPGPRLVGAGLIAALVLVASTVPAANAAERGVTFAPSGGGGYGGYGGGWSGGGAQPGPPGPPGPNTGIWLQPDISVPMPPDQNPMPPGAPLIPPDQIQAIVSGAGYARVGTPQLSQGYYYMKASSAAGDVMLAVDARSGQVVSSRPIPSTPRPPVVDSGSLIGNGSLIGTPPPTVPRGPLAPDPNNPDGE